MKMREQRMAGCECEDVCEMLYLVFHVIFYIAFSHFQPRHGEPQACSATRAGLLPPLLY